MKTFLPSHLAGGSSFGICPGESVAQFELGNYKNFVYLILDWSTRKSAIVDPQEDLSLPLDALKKNGFELCGIFLTHTHHDHIAGVPGLIQRWPQISIFLHQADRHRLGQEIQANAVVHAVAEGDQIPVGSLNVKVLHTPGHSAGECCYLMRAGAEGHSFLFTGDTVFIRDCGRTDLPTGSTEQMFQTLQRLKSLDPGTILLPGHHYAFECATTLERELRESPPFQCNSVIELERLP